MDVLSLDPTENNMQMGSSLADQRSPGLKMLFKKCFNHLHDIKSTLRSCRFIKSLIIELSTLSRHY